MTEWFVGLLADIAAFLTAVVAVWVWSKFVWAARSRRKEVEEYLRLEREADEYGGHTKGMRSMEQLKASLAMTEQQIEEAIFSSSVIKIWPVYESEHTDHVSHLGFQYEPKARQMRQRDRASTRNWIERGRQAAAIEAHKPGEPD